MSARRALQYYGRWLRLTFDPTNTAFKSARNFVAFFGVLGLLIFAPRLNELYPVVGPRMSEHLQYIPILIVFVVLPFFFFLAPYRIHEEQEEEITTRQSRLDAIEQSRAQLELTGVETSFNRRVPTEKNPGSYEDTFFAYATFTNESPRSEETAVAKQVVAHISYHDKKGQQVWTSDLGEWWPGLEPPPHAQVSRKEIESTEFSMGVSRRLSIAFKTKDGSAFGFCCYSRSCPGWRFKKLRLPEDEYTVKVTLQGVNVPQTVHTFVLKNPGPGRPLEISGEPEN